MNSHIGIIFLFASAVRVAFLRSVCGPLLISCLALLPRSGYCAESPVSVLPAGVKPVWDLAKAHRDTTPTRERVCLNGLWQWQPTQAEAGDNPPTNNWGYFKVPGSWPGITDYMQKDCQTVHVHPSWKDVKLGSVTSAWYRREITVPAEWKDRRIVVQAECVNSFATVYVDRKKAGDLRFPGGELDVSALCRPGNQHVLEFRVLAMPLKMLGFSINSADPGELAQAQKLLTDLAPHILALDSDTYQDKLASEEAVLCLGWTGPLLALREDPKTADTKYVVPSEGTLFWLDTWVMMADAPHPNATYAWFDYVERPAVQAKETEYTGYGTPNLEAKKLLSPDLLNDPAIFPPEDIMKNLEGADPTVTDNADRIAVWTAFKSSIGG